MAQATGSGHSEQRERKVRHGFSLMEGKSRHQMEDYLVAEYRKVEGHDLGLYAIYDGHMGHHVPSYLQHNLFNNILNEEGFWSDPLVAIKRAYHRTDNTILEHTRELGPGGSTAVTAILVDGKKLLVANVGDSRAVLSRAGKAIQLSIDHDPGVSQESDNIRKQGGFVVQMPGDVPRVDGQLAVSRAFGDVILKPPVSSDPDISEELIDAASDFMILGSDGLWTVMNNQEAIDMVKDIKDPEAAAKQLIKEALSRKSRDDISCIVVRFY